MKNILLSALTILYINSAIAQELSESNKLGVGLASSWPSFGISAKYNITETHSTQLILGGASFNFGSSSFAVTGRYLYNFEESGSSFIYRPYAYGQVGYFTTSINTLFFDETFNTVSFGLGGGIEFMFENFINGLSFNTELGYIGGSFNNNIGTFDGFAWGFGIHYNLKI